jgi:hypothetical protein
MRDIAPTRMNDVNLSDAGGVLGGRPGMRGRQGPGTNHGGIPPGDVASASDGGGWRTVGTGANHGDMPAEGVASTSDGRSWRTVGSRGGTSGKNAGGNAPAPADTNSMP